MCHICVQSSTVGLLAHHMGLAILAYCCLQHSEAHGDRERAMLAALAAVLYHCWPDALPLGRSVAHTCLVCRTGCAMKLPGTACMCASSLNTYALGCTCCCMPCEVHLLQQAERGAGQRVWYICRHSVQDVLLLNLANLAGSRLEWAEFKRVAVSSGRMASCNMTSDGSMTDQSGLHKVLIFVCSNYPQCRLRTLLTCWVHHVLILQL
jgi:hypothetical protein